ACVFQTSTDRGQEVRGVAGRPGITDIARCCARAASGHAAALPRSEMNWRRLRSSMGSSPEPAVPAYGRGRGDRKGPQVLGVDRIGSESRRRPGPPLNDACAGTLTDLSVTPPRPGLFWS